MVGRESLSECGGASLNTSFANPISKVDLLHPYKRHVAHARGSDVHAIDLSRSIPGEPNDKSLPLEMVLIDRLQRQFH